MRLRFPGRARHVAFFIAGAGLLALALPNRTDPGKDRASALAAALKERGLIAAPGDAQWIDPPRRVLGGSARAIVRAAPSAGEPNDLFLVDTSLSPEGVLLAVGDTYNLTETSGADESRPIVRGTRVAYIAHTSLEGVAPTVHVLDLGGQPPPEGDWSRIERAQNAVTNWQETGQLRGIGKRTFAIEAASEGEGGEAKAPEVSIQLDADTLVIRVDARVASVALATPDAELPAWIRPDESEIAKPPTLVQWSVDRVRSVPWIGDDRMQWVKMIAFGAKELIDKGKENVTGDTGADDIAQDLGKNELDPPTRSIPVDPEIGWPPPPLEPWVVPPLPGEGQWNPKDNDPFVRTNPGLPPAFLTTFIRTDRSRKVTRVYVALWDPRQVELHMVAGTVEPKGATGEAGPGIIPRTPEVMKRVVAASNAGFQALHGEFGMMADGVVYLPPKPYGATVSVLRDGSTAFGSWPSDQTIPAEIRSYRQNMTVMVQDEKFNPYNRTWWGGTPPGWADKTHTVRTGICLTRERFVAYFYGADLSPEALAQAMIQTRCSYGIALDMNAGHSGLEFYKVAPTEELEPLGRPLQHDWEAEGDVPGIDGFRFRARRLIRGMGLMHFPRYIKREARDYFYMTLRPVLPGPNVTPLVTPPSPGEGEWRLKGLAQHGFPYAVALTDLRLPGPTPMAARVLKIDPRTVRALPLSTKTNDKTVAILEGSAEQASGDALSLWHSEGAFSIGSTPPVPSAARIAMGKSKGEASAALGVNDEDGMLIYVELSARAVAPTPGLGASLEDVLTKLGCSSKLLLAAPLSVALGGDTDLAGAAVHAPSGVSAVRLSRIDAPGARRIFEDTQVVPFNVWYPLQQKRIRYFKKREQASGGDENN